MKDFVNNSAVSPLRFIKKRVQKKLTSKHGESLSEVLVASLVMSLGILLLATMMMSSFKIIGNSRTSFADYYDKVNTLELGSGTGITSSTVDVTFTENGTLGIGTLSVTGVPAKSVNTGKDTLTRFGY